MCNTLVHFGQDPWTEADAKVKIHRSLREYFPDLFGAQWEEASQKYYDSYHEHRSTRDFVNRASTINDFPGRLMFVVAVCVEFISVEHVCRLQ